MDVAEFCGSEGDLEPGRRFAADACESFHGMVPLPITENTEPKNEYEGKNISASIAERRSADVA